jgi:hypothetical protein
LWFLGVMQGDLGYAALTDQVGSVVRNTFLLGQLPWLFGDMTPRVASSIL